MINPLSLDAINERAPYHVDYLSDADTYVFTTDTDVELAVYFIDDELIQSALAYQLIVSNVNNQRSPRDKKVQQTILTIVEDFFDKNQAALLYICGTGDGKQMARYRLFSHWFDHFEYALRFTCMTTSLVDEEGIPNAAALFIRNDNPHLKELVEEFNQAATLLRQKPS